jgi:hypothetical protein
VRTTYTYKSDGEPLDGATPSPSAYPSHEYGSPLSARHQLRTNSSDGVKTISFLRVAKSF